MRSDSPESIARRKVKLRWGGIKGNVKKLAAATTDGERELLTGYLTAGIASYKKHVAILAKMPDRPGMEKDPNFVQPAAQAAAAIERLERLLKTHGIKL